ncbi:unnamed protein product, partial [Mesorhabditis spiculigera]
MRLHGKRIRDPIEEMGLAKELQIRHKTYGLIGTRKYGLKARRYFCASCPFNSVYCYQLWHHARRHVLQRHPDAKQCPACSYSTIFPQRLADHTRLHPQLANGTAEPSTFGATATKPGEHKCDMCPFQTDTYSRLWGHKQKHENNGKFVCTQCSFQHWPCQRFVTHQRLHENNRAGSSDGSENRDSQNEMETLEEYKPKVGKRSSPPGENTRSGFDPLPTIEREGSPSDLGDSPPPRAGSGSEGKDEKPECSSPPDLGMPFNELPDPEIVFKRMRALLPPHLQMALAGCKSESASSATSTEAMMKCVDPNCPYVEEDPLFYRIHLEMHGGKRNFQCSICTYNTHSPDALCNHLDLHTEGYDALKKISTASSRRMAREVEQIVEGGEVYSCVHCNYRTMCLEKYKLHRVEHAQTQQNRLKSLIKRSTQNEEEWVKPRLPTKKRANKEYFCRHCGFESSSLLTYERHVQMHGAPGYFKCRHCDYASSTAIVVDFHEIHHHMDQPLTQLMKKKVLQGGESSQMSPEELTATRVRMTGQEVRCDRCDWTGFERAALLAHFSENHVQTEEDRERATDMYLGLHPKNTIRTIASA